MDTITCWEDLLNAEKEYRSQPDQSWIFRGQPWGPGTSRYPLSSTLERACFELTGTLTNAPILEQKLVREFASCYHFYVTASPPRQGDTFEWRTLMRHYGAPSRLLDFTFSFFIAAFFAANDTDGDSVIWAVERNRLSELATRTINTIHGNRALAFPLTGSGGANRPSGQ